MRKQDFNRNTRSEKGILNRQIPSIQTKGHFGNIKENENFRRFHYRSKEKVYKEFMLYTIGWNINKYHRFLHEKIKQYEGKKIKRQLRPSSGAKNPAKGLLLPKIEYIDKRRPSCFHSRRRKSPNFTGRSPFEEL